MPCCVVLSNSTVLGFPSPLACIRVETAPLSMMVHRSCDFVDMERLRKNVAILAWAGVFYGRLDTFCFSFFFFFFFFSTNFVLKLYAS